MSFRNGRVEVSVCERCTSCQVRAEAMVTVGGEGSEFSVKVQACCNQLLSELQPPGLRAVPSPHAVPGSTS